MTTLGGLSLHELAAKIAVEGPAKHEPARRRLRGLVGSEWVFDTLDAEYVWENPHYPLFYVPLTCLEKANCRRLYRPPVADSRGFWVGTLSVADRKIDVAGFTSGPLKGLVKIPPTSLDAWYAEDEKLLGPHPKDPYKRIECLPSSREVLIQVEGVFVAKSSNNVFLHETGCRTRYYLSATPTAMDRNMLVPSDTTTFCPYKGQASYYHLQVPMPDGSVVVVRDAIWYYEYPTAESAQIQGRLCFYNEKVQIWVDGVRENN
ncbi:hypothetical protein B0H63DRAFT_485523 [Podospora didyma]|uniref:DUF427 domain-containing protein n=1 Tax=Podospora didyma TaxID=330526 RepID=A0AAE0N6L5_9PEZI|nr:hypothetical protein B0H63DRAFT_485523 [Podospora didyma]